MLEFNLHFQIFIFHFSICYPHYADQESPHNHFRLRDRSSLRKQLFDHGAQVIPAHVDLRHVSLPVDHK